MAYQPDAAFAGLFRAFTSDPQSIGAHLTQQMALQAADAPMLVSTGSDIVLFPGGGRAPSIESFRKSTRGFIELTAVSHLPLALAYLARMREVAPHDETWRSDAARLRHHAQETRDANSVALWRDRVAVESFSGHERKIANLVDYTCGVTIELLARAEEAPALLNFERLNAQYFAASPSNALPVPMNDVMFATFGLAFLDIVYRIGNWLRAQSLDWQRAMVLVSGRSGRPTAGATWASNNMCFLVWRASECVLQPERILVAPHAPSFSVAELPDEAGLAELERTYRGLWLNTRASIDVARSLFPEQRAYHFEPAFTDGMPPISSIDDRDATAARLRRIMEDPAQLLSNCVADYIVDQLYSNGNQPQNVAIPGFTNVSYPDAVSL
ncbi:hypothetical protein EOS_12640 [Caballeronia mineralivorans PML1(12)]|uniref:DUF5624 domain-containing protein n=1 Tax=Caballeronia mineralivorans PML1(12) TaxID=908627 RepID=A0A0J1CZG0_9BURK|nr:DUF5624 domain-containing protein [Caballeronia mineralivorans]KLU25736.1 hypothetical protein EOS_12640 [Caballeronia mineralivorans PML1(12)]